VKRFFFTFRRGNETVFAREVEADNFFAAMHHARQAMIRMHVATARDFALGAVRPTNMAELADGSAAVDEQAAERPKVLPMHSKTLRRGLIG
jgi:hypothetical protein